MADGGEKRSEPGQAVGFGGTFAPFFLCDRDAFQGSTRRPTQNARKRRSKTQTVYTMVDRVKVTGQGPACVLSKGEGGGSLHALNAGPTSGRASAKVVDHFGLPCPLFQPRPRLSIPFCSMSLHPLSRLNPVSDVGIDAHHSPGTCLKSASFVNPWPSDLSPLWPHNLSNIAYRPPFHADDKAHEAKLPNGKTRSGEDHPVRVVEEWQSDLGEDGLVKACWLGHASFLVSFPVPSTTDGEGGGDAVRGRRTNVLFDPVFEDRCSPIQDAGPQRDQPPPCSIADLPVRRPSPFSPFPPLAPDRPY